MTKDKQPNKPPTFLTAITTIMLGILIVGLSVVVTVFINYFGFFSLGLGLVILFIGRIQWKQFQATLPENDSETGETANIEHQFGKRDYYEFDKKRLEEALRRKDK